MPVSLLVGGAIDGNGTTHNLSKYGYMMMKMDAPGTAGYLTAD